MLIFLTVLKLNILCGLEGLYWETTDLIPTYYDTVFDQIKFPN